MLFRSWVRSGFDVNLPPKAGLLLPFFKEVSYPLGVFGFVILTYLVIVGSSNAVNLTDGLDGLAIMPVVMVGSALGVFAYVTGSSVFSRYLFLPHIPGAGELLIFCAAMAGAGLAFLWFNTHPAQVFMGGDFIGESAMPSVAPKDEFRIFFGPDRALRAKREVLSKSTGSSGLFGGSTVTTWNDRITLDNGTGRDVTVELYDRRPVSLNEKIEVKVPSIVPALSTDKRFTDGRAAQGILRWDLTVPAAARGPKAATVNWTVEVSRANDVRTTPLPD